MIEQIRNSKAHIFVKELSDIITITGKDYIHLAKSLRLKTGEHISVANYPTVNIYKITHIDSDLIEAHLTSVFENVMEPQIELFVSLFKIDRLEMGIAKATETGATKIYIGSTARSSIKIGKDKIEKLSFRFSEIAKNAAMQSRRAQVPQVIFTNGLIGDFLKSNLERFVCDPSGTANQLGVPCSILIGPEGGLSEEEFGQLEANSRFLKLSDHILRAETAMAIAPTKI